MAAAGLFKGLYLRHFAKPASDRRVFAAICRERLGCIVEIGVGRAVRAQRMIELAQRYHAGEVRYTGVDMFEGREKTARGLPLKQAYQLLRRTGAKVRLVPGDPFAGLARAANSLTGTQLLLISADQDQPSLERAWFYVPRMLSPKAVVFVERLGEDGSQVDLQKLSRAEIDSLAGANDRRRRAA